MNYPQRLLEIARRICTGSRLQKKDAWYRFVMQGRGIDLRWNSVEDLGLSTERSESHGNSGGPSLRVVLATLDILPSDSVLDIGCGKGGAMITLAQWPFGRIDGIEISPHLITIAQRNLKQLGRSRGTIRLCDAGDFKELDQYTFLYMFHPFLEVVMRRVLGNVQASLLRAPRRLTLIYTNPVYHQLVVASGFRPINQFDHTSIFVRVYESAGIQRMNR